MSPQPYPDISQGKPDINATSALFELVMYHRPMLTREDSWLLSDYDMFGKPVQLNWNRRDAFKTKFGTCLSLIWLVLIMTIWGQYLREFIEPLNGSIVSGNDNGPLEKDPDRDLGKEIYPTLQLLHTIQIPYIPLTVKQTDCNFELSGARWNVSYERVGHNSVPTKRFPLKRGCKNWPDQINQNFTPKNKLAEEHGYCLEGEKMEVWGDPMKCTHATCQWWIYRIEFASTRNIDGTSTDPTCTNHMISNGDIRNYLKFLLMRANSSANESDYNNPFETQLEEESLLVRFENQFDNNGTEYSLIQSKSRKYTFKNMAITTDARNIGISYVNFTPSVVNKLQYDSYTELGETFKRYNLTDPKVLLDIAFTPGIRHTEINRTYPSQLDALGNIGGLFDIVFWPLAFIYSFYIETRWEYDLQHKGAMVTGKYGVTSAEARHQEAFYDPACIQMPSYRDKLSEVFCGCCKKKHINASQRPGQSDKLEDNETLQTQEAEHKEEDDLIRRALESIVERQTDLKHLMHLCQDVEMIKRVLFQERHLLLGPIVALEYEKRSLKRYDERIEHQKERETHKNKWLHSRTKDNLSKAAQTTTTSFYKKESYPRVEKTETRVYDSPGKPDAQPVQIPFYLSPDETPINASINLLDQSMASPQPQLRSSTNSFGLDTGAGLNFTNVKSTSKVPHRDLASDPEIGLGMEFVEIKRVITSIGTPDGSPDTDNIEIRGTGGQESSPLEQNALAKKIGASLAHLEQLEAQRDANPTQTAGQSGFEIFEARLSAIETKNDILETKNRVLEIKIEILDGILSHERASHRKERDTSKNLQSETSNIKDTVSQLTPNINLSPGQPSNSSSAHNDLMAQYPELAQSLQRMQAKAGKRPRAKNIKEQLDNPIDNYWRQDQHAYRTDMYKELERGYLPHDIYAKTAIKKAVSNLLYKPNHEKNSIEYNLDQMFIEYLPAEFLSPEENSKKGNLLSEQFGTYLLGIRNPDNVNNSFKTNLQEANARGEDIDAVEAQYGQTVIDGDWCVEDDDPVPYEVNRSKFYGW